MNRHLTTTLAVVLIACLMLPIGVAADVPATMNYQGRLTNSSGDPVNDRTYTVRFRIYNDDDKGDILWDETQSVVSSDGFIDVMLGVVTPLDPDIFGEADRWLGITVGTDSEMSPRIKLASNPYAFAAHQADSLTTDPYLNESGDVLTGDLNFQSSGTNSGAIDLGSGAADLKLADGGSIKAYIYGSSYGTIFLNDASGTRTATLNATDDQGGILQLESNSGTLTIALNGGETGDLSAVLPNDAINSDEIFNEPGIAASNNLDVVHLTPNSTMEDLETVSINIPDAGYIVVQAQCFIVCWGTTGTNRGYIQIDETPWGSEIAPHYVAFGFNGYASAGYSYLPVHITRTFYKSSADLYTFRIEARALEDNDVFANTQTGNHTMTATYYPSSYGTVETSVSAEEAASFDRATPVISGDETISKSSEQRYQVDLRELELKAKQARIEALEAELELKRAQDEAAAEERATND